MNVSDGSCHVLIEIERHVDLNETCLDEVTSGRVNFVDGSVANDDDVRSVRSVLTSSLSRISNGSIAHHVKMGHLDVGCGELIAYDELGVCLDLLEDFLVGVPGASVNPFELLGELGLAVVRLVRVQPVVALLLSDRAEERQGKAGPSVWYLPYTSRKVTSQVSLVSGIVVLHLRVLEEHFRPLFDKSHRSFSVHE